MAREVTEAEFQTAVVDRSHEVAVVIDFWAPWCEPCRQLGPLLERVVEEMGGAVELVKINVDENPHVSQSFRVQGIPAVFAMRDGQVVSAFVGAQPEAAVREFVSGLLPTEADQALEAGYALLEAGDLAGAEPHFRQVLEADPARDEARLGLAEVLVRSGEVEEGLGLLTPLPETTEVRRIRALAQLAGASGDLGELEAAAATDPAARLLLAAALASAGREQDAIDTYLAVIRDKGGPADPARVALLDLFALLGEQDPRVNRGRRELASALF